MWNTWCCAGFQVFYENCLLQKRSITEIANELKQERA